MEVEAKFGIPDEETFQHLLKLDTLAGLRLQPLPRIDVHDLYFDTAGGHLRIAGVACRLRRTDGRFIGAVKGLGSAQGAIHRRVEREVTLDHPLSPEEWPAGELRALVKRLSGGQPLRALFTLEQERHRRIASDADRIIAEISLDRVRVCRDGVAVEQYLEAEAELLAGGSMDDLVRIAGCLAGEWELEPQPRSKFERALAHLSSVPAERGQT